MIRLSFREPRAPAHRNQGSSPNRRSERGFALILALVLSLLYFGFIELLMMDASRELSEARRFRARIVGLTLAENGAELAAVQLIKKSESGTSVTFKDELKDEQGISSGTLTVNGGQFDLVGIGRSTGREATNGWVKLEGKVEGPRIIIYFSRHTQ